MKTALTLAAFAVCATMVAPLHVYGQLREEDDEGKEDASISNPAKFITELVKPVSDASAAQKKTITYYETIAIKYQKKATEFETTTKQYNDNVKKLKNDTDKVNATIAYLEKKGEYIQMTLDDLDFARKEFDKAVETVTQFLGDIDGKGSLATKAAERKKDLENFQKIILDTKREYEVMQSGKTTTWDSGKSTMGCPSPKIAQRT